MQAAGERQPQTLHPAFPPSSFFSFFLKEHGSNYVLAFPLQRSEVLMGTEHQKRLI